MEAEKKTPENKTGEKKKRKLWPIFLIIGIVLAIAAILLIVVVVIGAIFIKKASNDMGASFTYEDYIANIDMSKKPETIMTPSGDPYDYTFINDAITKDSSSVEDWINKYYPGSSIQKTKASGHDEFWTVTSLNPMNPISVKGVVVNYDKVEIYIQDGYGYKIYFVQSGGDETKFDNLYKSLMFKLTYTAPNVTEASLFNKTESTRYLWSQYEFDDFYWLELERDVTNSQAEIKVAFSVL